MFKASAQPVHARRAGRDDGRGQDRRDRCRGSTPSTTPRRRRWTRPATPRCSPSTSHTKLGEAYPMSPFLEAADRRAARGQPLGHRLPRHADRDREPGPRRVRRHAAAGSEEPLLRKLLRYVMSDEARHVAFGVLSLQELYQSLSEAELKDRQEFLVENTLRSHAPVRPLPRCGNAWVSTSTRCGRSSTRRRRS